MQCWRADAYHETFVGGLLLTMANLYTMNGRPLTRRRDDLFTRSGNHIGHVQGERCSALTGDTSARLSAIVWSTAAQTAHTVISVWTTGRCCLELGQRRRLRGLGRGTYDPGLSDEPVLCHTSCLVFAVFGAAQAASLSDQLSDIRSAITSRRGMSDV